MKAVVPCLAIVAMLVSAPARAQSATVTLVLPFSPACVSSPFGARNAVEPRASKFHTGIDLPAPAGAWVHASAAGTVVAIRRRGSAGLEVELRHTANLTTRYDHLGTVAPGLMGGKRAVAQGDSLGRVGRTGITYGTHLHFELLINGVRVDPAAALPVHPCYPKE